MSFVAIVANHLIDDNVHRDWLRSKYVQAVDLYSDMPCVLVPPSLSLAGQQRVLSSAHGIMLTGDESDVDEHVLITRCMPEEYEWKAEKRDHYRDVLAFTAVDIAIKKSIPLFGICRGIQEINVCLGGRLVADLKSSTGIDHTEDLHLARDDQYRPVHSVTVQPAGVLSQALGYAPDVSKKIQVNSLHHQGIETVGTGIRVEAISDDGIVEAISIREAVAWQLAVQWHPEWHVSSDPISQKLFKAFGDACKELGNSH